MRGKRDWAERGAERLWKALPGLYEATLSLPMIARALRRAEKRGYERGKEFYIRKVSQP